MKRDDRLKKLESLRKGRAIMEKVLLVKQVENKKQEDTNPEEDEGKYLKPEYFLGKDIQSELAK